MPFLSKFNTVIADLDRRCEGLVLDKDAKTVRQPVPARQQLVLRRVVGDLAGVLVMPCCVLQLLSLLPVPSTIRFFDLPRTGTDERSAGTSWPDR
jgi:hypothetical protein